MDFVTLCRDLNGFKKLQVLCQQDKDIVKRVDAQGCTLLFHAAKLGRADLVECLLMNGADVDARAKLANDRTPLLEAVKASSIAVANVLLQYGADVNAQDDNKRTPMMYAAQNDDIKMIKMLLESGARLDFKAELGKTAAEFTHNPALRGFLHGVQFAQQNVFYQHMQKVGGQKIDVAQMQRQKNAAHVM